jgi:hypothetical protein
MGKVVVYDFRAFCRGDLVEKKRAVPTRFKTAAATTLFMVPTRVLAVTGENTETWIEVWETVLTGADWLCVGVIVFAGGNWMFAHRTKAMELLLGGGIGYLIIRHAKDIQEWLATF